MATAVASLLKASSSYNNYTNQRIIITPATITTTTRTSLPINRKFINIPTISQNPLPKIITATTKCSSSSSSSSSRGSTTTKEEEVLVSTEEVLVSTEELVELILKALLKVVKGLEKPALTATLVWVLLTNNPTIAYASLGRTSIFLGIWLVYDLYKAIATRTRISEDRVRLSLGPVLGSIMITIKALMVVVFGFGTFGEVTGKDGSEITIVHKIFGYLKIFMMLFMLMLLGFGKFKWPPRSGSDVYVDGNLLRGKKEGSVNTDHY